MSSKKSIQKARTERLKILQKVTGERSLTHPRREVLLPELLLTDVPGATASLTTKTGKLHLFPENFLGIINILELYLLFKLGQPTSNELAVIKSDKGNIYAAEFDLEQTENPPSKIYIIREKGNQLLFYFANYKKKARFLGLGDPGTKFLGSIHAPKGASKAIKDKIPALRQEIENLIHDLPSVESPKKESTPHYQPISARPKESSVPQQQYALGPLRPVMSSAHFFDEWLEPATTVYDFD